jgi:hypothetical protein
MTLIERRARELGITEQAVDALVYDQSRPLMERVCEFAESVIANHPQGAVETLAWVADRYAKTLAGESVRDADEALERARLVLQQQHGGQYAETDQPKET